MAVSSEYLDYVHDQLSGLGGVTSRRMFGGAGLYCDEFFFALIDNDTLYLRVNDANRADFTTRGMSQFRPYPDSPQLSMSYYETPADVLEDAAALVEAGREGREGRQGRKDGQAAARGPLHHTMPETAALRA